MKGRPTTAGQTLSPCNAFLSVEFRGTLSECMSPANAGLYPDLYCLHRSKCNVCKELCTGTSSEVERGTILVGILLGKELTEMGMAESEGRTPTHLSKHAGIEYLENFIEPKLEKTLHGIANQSRGPPSAQGPYTFLSSSQPQSIEHVAIPCWIHLNREQYPTHCHTHCVCYCSSHNAQGMTICYEHRDLCSGTTLRQTWILHLTRSRGTTAV